MKQCIPGVGKYRPRFDSKFSQKPHIKFSEEGKEEYLRSRNFLIIPRFHQEYSTTNLIALQKQISQKQIINLESTMSNNEELSNLQSERKKLKKSKSHKSHQTMRFQINATPGLVPYNKQSERKFVFEKCCPVNEQRFNLINLPTIHT